MTAISDLLAPFPRVILQQTPTPLERLERISEHLDLDLWIKRDDLTGIGFGGNKIRQLEFYFGAARAAKADTILITGAVQSNFVRSAAAVAGRLGMRSILQLENRVPGKDAIYAASGNVLLGQILGAEHIFYPEGEDEAGADRALRDRAEALAAEGRHPYVIPLGLNNPPLGALGYMAAADEILAQKADFDAVVIPSGSGLTHAGLLCGMRAAGIQMPVHGICVRRDAEAQTTRIRTVCRNTETLLGRDGITTPDDIRIWDRALAPGYGHAGERAQEAMLMMARQEGIFLDPVYTAKSFAGVIGLRREGVLPPGARVLFVHTGGQPALFGYQSEIASDWAL